MKTKCIFIQYLLLVLILLHRENDNAYVYDFRSLLLWLEEVNEKLGTTYLPPASQYLHNLGKNPQATQESLANLLQPH
jgi:hypothetical protein